MTAQKAFVRVLSVEQTATGSTKNVFHLAVDWSGDDLAARDAIDEEVPVGATPADINTAIIDAVIARAQEWGIAIVSSDVRVIDSIT